MKTKAKNSFSALCCIALLLTGFTSAAPISMAKKESSEGTIRSLAAFGRIVILDCGRLKPLDTYAENLLLQFSGKKTAGRKPAIRWLARALLAPERAMPDKVLLINNPEIADALGISAERGRRYSFGQIMPGLRKLHALVQTSAGVAERQRSPFDLEILRLAENIDQYITLLEALRFTVTIPQLALCNGDDSCAADSVRAASLHWWTQTAATFNAGDQEAFDSASVNLARILARSWPPTIKAKDPGIELFYNRYNPFAAAKIFYGISLLFFIAYLSLNRRWMYGAGAIPLCSAVLLHTIGIVLRMMIMQRPPITNMYETFIFVGWMAALLGCVTEFFQKRGWGLGIAALSGFFLLQVAGKFALEGDTMGMLAAVLNSNFWLTSHVITIACGYAGCVAAGLLGHVSLIREFFSRKPSTSDDSLDNCVYGVLAFGFTCTVIGTVLGGLWADQAWGRFWGWDPKENGALAIILWCAFLFHARGAKWLSPRGFAAGSVAGVAIVICAWIGVNLAGVGMHAYGFSSTGSRVLFFVVDFEALFLSFTGIFAGLRKTRKKR